MGAKKIDKSKPKNWEYGDTFAIKIKNYESEYNNRYIIITKIDVSSYEERRKNSYFIARITKKTILNNDLEEIKELECIKTRFTPFASRFLPFHGDEDTLETAAARHSHMRYYPDKYNYLYTYCFYLDLDKKDLIKDFIYLGNYNLPSPEDEFLSELGNTDYILLSNFVDTLINEYKYFNLKQSPIFKEYLKVNEEAEKEIQFLLKSSKMVSEQLRKSKKCDKEIEESETYVGGEIFTSAEKNYEK